MGEDARGYSRPEGVPRKIRKTVGQIVGNLGFDARIKTLRVDLATTPQIRRVS